MRELSIEDLLPLEEYAPRRAEFLQAHLRYLDRYRRVRVGPRMTLVFENRQTLWFRVQEILRVARLTDPVDIQTELEWFNVLLPQRNELQAAMFFEGDCTSDLSAGTLRLQLGELACPARWVTNRPEDRAAGSAQWVEWNLDQELRDALADLRVPAYFIMDHVAYRHRSAALSMDTRQSLLDDLALSDRDQTYSDAAKIRSA